MGRTVYLLSPARCDGKRAAMLLRDGASFELAKQVRTPAGAPLGEVFSFMSGLYFRGKLAYARRFGGGRSGGLVITAGRGLVSAKKRVTIDDLREMASVPVDPGESRYIKPLLRDARRLRTRLGRGDRVVLLGSIATGKYAEPLLEALGPWLYFPSSFVGRGDMSRGGLLLRHAESGEPLEYIPLKDAPRRGPRPPKLPRKHAPATT